MKTHVREPEKKIPVIAHFDVLVVGGGIGGVSAALAAARGGATCAILEKECGLGGLATLGNIIKFLPLCDGEGHQVAGGLAEELIKISTKGIRRNEADLGLVQIPECWTNDASLNERIKNRYEAIFNPAMFQIELEALLQKEGVTIFYDTRFSSCLKKEDFISHVVVENKSGRLAISADVFIDATGDADLCYAANVETENFNYNVLCGWHYLLKDKKLCYKEFTKAFSCKNPEGIGEGPFFKGHSGKDVTKQVLQTRKWIREYLEEHQKKSPRKNVLPFALPSIPSFRATRRLNNSFVLSEGHMHTWFEDTIGIIGDWRKKGPVYTLPFRTIRADKVFNLFAVGRCISTDNPTWEVTRVLPACAVTGQAAGAAAAQMTRGLEKDWRNIEISMLQKNLFEQNVILDRNLVERQVHGEFDS